MAERPIPFSGPMVRAILDGRKTQTRRVLKPQPDSLARVDHIEHVVGTRSFDMHTGARFANGRFQGSERMQMVATPYALGDRLWVREAWRSVIGYNDRAPRDIPEGTPVRFEADDEMSSGWIWGRYRPGMFMPRWASRLTLEVTEVRIQRLQDISGEDAIAEGVLSKGAMFTWPNAHINSAPATARTAFSMLWCGINGAGSWDENPWVAVYTFKRVPQKGVDGTERHRFARAEAGIGGDADELAYRAALTRSDTEEMARLDAESQQRMAAFDARFPDGTL